MQVLLQYHDIIGQEVYYVQYRAFFYIIGQLLHYRAFLLHYRAVITVPAFITLSVGTGLPLGSVKDNLGSIGGVVLCLC